MFNLSLSCLLVYVLDILSETLGHLLSSHLFCFIYKLLPAIQQVFQNSCRVVWVSLIYLCLLLCLHLASAGAVSGDWKDFLWPQVAYLLRGIDVREFSWWCPLLLRFVWPSEWEGNLGSSKWPLRAGCKVSFTGSNESSLGVSGQ